MTEPTSPTSDAGLEGARLAGTFRGRGDPLRSDRTPVDRRHSAPRVGGSRDRSGRPGTAGFTLIELTLALLIIGLLAALGLPRVLPGAGNGTLLRAEAYRLAALLRADRNAALDGGRAVVTRIDPSTGVIRSERGDLVVLSRGTALSLAGPVGGGIRFEPDGRSSGGRLVLASAGGGRRSDARTAYTILVEPLTAGVVVATGAPR